MNNEEYNEWLYMVDQRLPLPEPEREIECKIELESAIQ